MEITSVRMKKHNKPNDTMVAIATVEFDNCFKLHDIKLIELDGKRMLSFPSKKIKRFVVENGEYLESYDHTDIAHPTNQTFREYVQKELFDIYDGKEIGNYE